MLCLRVFHGLVGGKTAVNMSLLPGPRAILLVLTLLLNIWLCTRLYFQVCQLGETADVCIA